MGRPQRGCDLDAIAWDSNGGRKLEAGGPRLAPRLGPATTREAVEQLRFAQLLGCIFCSPGVIGFALDMPVVGVTATGFALFAALIRAVFGICLSRRPYMLGSKMRGNVPACCQNK